jgi:hypothetical protein
MDVTSLYTNIPHNDGIEACREAWDQRAVKEPPTECLVQLLTLVLKHNNFTFNGEHAYEGAIFVPIAVPLICKKCSPLNVKLLCFSTNVSNWTRHSVGGSLTALWSQVSRSDASIYYLKFIKSTTPGDPLFQQMGTPQKKSPNSSISTFDLM